jgi:MFS family permease
MRSLGKMKLQQILRSLESRNYRVFFRGQSLSLLGSLMAQTAMLWLAYSLTKSALFLGIIGFVNQVPNFIFAPFAGVFLERWNRRDILLATQASSAIISLTLAGLALTDTINIFHIIYFSILQGILNSFDIPSRYAFIIEIIESKEDISNATALHSSLMTGSRMIGPAIAGIIIATLGAGYCFLIDGISYIAIIAALLAIKVPLKEVLTQRYSNLWARIKEGFIYAFEFLPIRSILMMMALVSFRGMPYKALMPIFAIQILDGDSATLGFLMGASGLGALFGCIYLSSRANVVGFSKIIAIAPKGTCKKIVSTFFKQGDMVHRYAIQATWQK